jgi:hypothetical protein
MKIRITVAAVALAMSATGCDGSPAGAERQRPDVPSLNSGGFGSGNRADSTDVTPDVTGASTDGEPDSEGRNGGGFGSGN